MQALKEDGYPEVRTLLVMGGVDSKTQTEVVRQVRLQAHALAALAAAAPCWAAAAACLLFSGARFASFRSGRSASSHLPAPLPTVWRRRVTLLVAACCALTQGVHMAICTPGRLKDLLHKKRMNLDICRCAPFGGADAQGTRVGQGARVPGLPSRPTGVSLSSAVRRRQVLSPGWRLLLPGVWLWLSDVAAAAEATDASEGRLWRAAWWAVQVPVLGRGGPHGGRGL